MEEDSDTNDGSDKDQPLTDPQKRYTRSNAFSMTDLNKQVYRAYDDETAVEVAWIEYTNLSPASLAALEKKGKLLETLDHEHCLKYYRCWSVKKENKFICITEVTSSGNLKKFLLRKMHNVMKPNVIRNWVEQVLSGLHYLHSQDPPLMHLDIRCENIFISGNVSQVKIGALEVSDLLMTCHPAEFDGSPGFMAPEPTPSILQDIYAFGMTVLQMFTYDYPYSECQTSSQIWEKSNKRELPRAFDQIKNQHIRQFIAQCLKPEAERPDTAALLADQFLKINFDELADDDDLIVEAKVLETAPPPSTKPPSTAAAGQKEAKEGARSTTSSAASSLREDDELVPSAGTRPRAGSPSAVAAGSLAPLAEVPTDDAVRKAYFEEGTGPPQQTGGTGNETTGSSAGKMPSEDPQGPYQRLPEANQLQHHHHQQQQQQHQHQGQQQGQPGSVLGQQQQPERELKVFWDSTGEEAGVMECVRIDLSTLTSVRDLKLRIIEDFALSIISDMLDREAAYEFERAENAEKALQQKKLETAAAAASVASAAAESALDSSPSAAAVAAAADAVSSFDRDGEERRRVMEDTVSKIKLKYKDRDGDYVTILDRTKMSEIYCHAVSFHVYLLEVIKASKNFKQNKLEGLIDL